MKGKILAAALVGFLVVAGSAGAFNTEGELAAAVNCKDTLYTAYWGQPVKDLIANFRGAKDWEIFYDDKKFMLIFNRTNTEDDFVKTHVFAQYFNVRAVTGPTATKGADGRWYTNGRFPMSGDWVVNEFNVEFCVKDREHAEALYDRAEKMLTDKYGEEYMADKKPKNAPPRSGAKWRDDDHTVDVFLNSQGGLYTVKIRHAWQYRMPLHGLK